MALGVWGILRLGLRPKFYHRQTLLLNHRRHVVVRRIGAPIPPAYFFRRAGEGQEPPSAEETEAYVTETVEKSRQALQSTEKTTKEPIPHAKRRPQGSAPKRKYEMLRRPWDMTPVWEQKQGGTMLHWAVDPFKEQETRLLLAKNVLDVNARDQDGQTPLHVVATQDEPDAVGLLLNHGADVNAVDKDGSTPLHIATRCKSKRVMDALLKAGADIEAKNKRRETPLHTAVRRNAIPAAKLLLAAGARVDPPSGAVTTSLLHFTTNLNRKKLLQLFLDHTPPPNASFARRPDGVTPLHIAARMGQYRAVYMLLSKGAGVNARDARGDTPLHMAARETQAKAVAVLCQMGADTRLKNRDGCEPHEGVVRAFAQTIISDIPGLVQRKKQRGDSGVGKLVTGRVHPKIGVCDAAAAMRRAKKKKRFVEEFLNEKSRRRGRRRGL